MSAASRGAGGAAGGMGASLETLRGVLAVARMEGEGDGEESAGGDARAAAAAKKALAVAFSKAMDGCALTQILRRALGGVASRGAQISDG